MKDTFTIKHEIKPFELINLFWYQTIRMKIFKRLLLFITIVSLVSILTMCIAPGSNKINWFVEIGKSLLPLVFVVCFFLIGGGLVSFLLMKIKPNNYKGITYTFTHWGTEKRGKGIDYSMQWSKFLNVQETKHFILLYVTRNDAHVIQKRFFKDERELQEFRTFVSKNLNVAL